MQVSALIGLLGRSLEFVEMNHSGGPDSFELMRHLNEAIAELSGQQQVRDDFERECG